MKAYEITVEMNLKKVITKSREVAQILNEFANNLEQIENKYSEPQERSENQKKIVDAHWIDNHNGTISCSHCHTWFNKDNRYYYKHYCPYCSARIEREQMNETDN